MVFAGGSQAPLRLSASAGFSSPMIAEDFAQEIRPRVSQGSTSVLVQLWLRLIRP
jgi:hypothetical protein